MIKSDIKVGFIGLGLMGNPMSKNILQKGFSLFVYNRTQGKTTELETLGAVVVSTPKELTEKCDVVITMVTDSKSVEDVLFGKDGVVDGKHKNLTVIDMSTIGPTAVRSIAEKLKPYEISFIDAPVTGSTPKAITGELTIFVGGTQAVFEKVLPVLSAMGTNIIYMGESGSGQAVKLLNNYLIASHIESLAESMLLADIMKLPREKVAEALTHTPTLSANAKMKIQNFISDTYPLFFSLSNMRKDLGLARAEMEKGNGDLSILRSIESIYGKANENDDYTAQDFTIIIKHIEKKKKR